MIYNKKLKQHTLVIKGPLFSCIKWVNIKTFVNEEKVKHIRIERKGEKPSTYQMLAPLLQGHIHRLHQSGIYGIRSCAFS